MAIHTIADVLYGIVRYRRGQITTGDFLLKKTITVANDDTITIDGNYTSDGNAPASKTIFTGRIDDVDYSKTQYIHAIDISEEMYQVRPSGTYGGYTECVLGKVINDNSLINVLCTQSSGNITIKPDGDSGVQDWSDVSFGDNDGLNYDEIDEDIGVPDGNYITATVDEESAFTLGNHSLSANYHYYIYKVEVISRLKGSAIGTIGINLFDGTDWLTEEIHDITNVFDTYTAEYNDLNLTEDDINDLKVNLRSVSGAIYACDTINVKVYYYYYPNLTKCTEKGSYNFGGDRSIIEVLKVLNLVELKTWYIDADYQIRFDGGDTASGKTISATDKTKNIIGSRQVKSYDKVVLYGKYTAGSQITSTRGAGNIIWRDNYLDIDDQTLLDSTADQILVEQGANRVKVKLKRRNVTDGLYQVGETVEVGAGVKFSNSDKTIPIAVDATYILNKIDYIITNGVYNTLDIEIIDGLLFSTPKDDSLSVVQDTTSQTSLGLTQVAGGESVGQANTGSNIGTDGVGVYDSKSGVTLRFRNVAPASSAITVVENGDDIDIDLSLLGLEDLTDPDADRIYFWDDGAGKTDWLIANTGLAISGLNLNCTITQYTNAMADARIAAADHDTLLNPNGNAEEQHMTSAQIAALHAIYTDAEAVAAVLADDAYLKLVGDTMSGVLAMGGNEIENTGKIGVGVTDQEASVDINEGTAESQTNWSSNTIPYGTEKADLVLTRRHGSVKDGTLGYPVSLIDFRATNASSEWSVAQIIGGGDPLGGSNYKGALSFLVSDGGSINATGRRTTGAAPEVAMLLTTTYTKMFFPINMNTNKITDMGTPTADTDASTKKYVDDSTVATLTLQQVTDHGATSSTAIALSGALTVIAPTTDFHAATKKFVDEHVATQNLAMADFDITGCGSIRVRTGDSVRVYGSGDSLFMDLSHNNTDQRIWGSGGLIVQPNGDIDDYFYLYTSANIPRLGVVGCEDLYFYDGKGANWNTIHADAFTEHSAPLPIDNKKSLEQLIKIKNTPDNLEKDYSTIPLDAYYEDKNGENKGVNINKIVWHLVNTIKELNDRIIKLEVK